MVETRVLRVFVDRADRFGNPLGVVLEAHGPLSDHQRQQITVSLGFSECVFITDLAARRIDIRGPAGEVIFSGHAAIGAAWMLANVLGHDIESMTGPNGRIDTWTNEDVVWVQTQLRWTPPWLHERLPSAHDVASLRQPQDPSQTNTQLWAWLDRDNAQIRARTFASAWGIREDEANGSGCMRLAAALGQRIEVLHGQGSVIHAEPSGPGSAAVGGRVAEDNSRVLNV